MIYCRISLSKVLKMPGVKEMVEVVSQLTRSKCGVSLVQEALEDSASKSSIQSKSEGS